MMIGRFNGNRVILIETIEERSKESVSRLTDTTAVRMAIKFCFWIFG